jgi:hypothetical protein
MPNLRQIRKTTMPCQKAVQDERKVLRPPGKAWKHGILLALTSIYEPFPFPRPSRRFPEIPPSIDYSALTACRYHLIIRPSPIPVRQDHYFCIEKRSNRFVRRSRPRPRPRPRPRSQSSMREGSPRPCVVCFVQEHYFPESAQPASMAPSSEDLLEKETCAQCDYQDCSRTRSCITDRAGPGPRYPREEHCEGRNARPAARMNWYIVPPTSCSFVILSPKTPASLRYVVASNHFLPW